MENVQFLVATMNLDDSRELFNKMNLENENVIVVNQSNYEKIDRDGDKTVISMTGKGLSKSRNTAIRESSAEISVICDDDMTYVENVGNIITDTFKNNPGIDVLAFVVNGKNEFFKDYSEKEYRVSYLKSMKICSVQLAFRTESVKENNLYFNEKFGSGTDYYLGEENIWLFDCLRSDLKIKFVPIKIGEVFVGESTWFSGYDDKYLNVRGASFAAMTPKWYRFLNMQFAIRKRKLFSNSIISIYVKLREGSSEYFKEMQCNE